MLKEFRDSLTVCSGLSHPDVGGGHAAEVSFLTAARRPGSGSFRNSISLDQFAVERLKPDTRFACLVLSTNSSSISFSPAGVQIPPETRPSASLSISLTIVPAAPFGLLLGFTVAGATGSPANRIVGYNP